MTFKLASQQKLSDRKIGTIATPVDPYAANVTMLIPGTGTNGSTVFTDLTGLNTMTGAGNAQISTAQSKFGAGSIRLDGAGDYISTPGSPGWAFGTGDFTIEFWAYLVTIASGARRFWSSEIASPYPLSMSVTGSTAGGATTFSAQINGTGLNQYPSPAVTVGNWHHWALVRASSQVKHFVDGLQVGSNIANSANITETQELWLGCRNYASSPTYEVDCYMNDFRITKGVARYTSTFSPPTAHFGL